MLGEQGFSNRLSLDNLVKWISVKKIGNSRLKEQLMQIQGVCEGSKSSLIWLKHWVKVGRDKRGEIEEVGMAKLQAVLSNIHKNLIFYSKKYEDIEEFSIEQRHDHSFCILDNGYRVLLDIKNQLIGCISGENDPEQ